MHHFYPHVPLVNYFYFLILFSTLACAKILISRIRYFHREQRKSAFIDIVLIVLSGCFFYFSALEGKNNPPLQSVTPVGYYNELVENLLKGKLDLAEQPDSRLVQIPEPHPPQNRPDIPIKWDCSYFEGHYYLYWGIAPVLTFVLPYYLMTGKYASEIAQGLFFCFLAFVFCYLFTLKLLIFYLKRSPTDFERILVWGIFCLSCIFGNILRRCVIYEIALFAGVAFVVASWYFCLNGILKPRIDKTQYLLSGLCFSLAIASRPTTACTAILLVYLFIFSFQSFKKTEEQVKFLFIGAYPVLLLVVTYNYLRYHNIFEFGLRYQLNHLQMLEWGFSVKDTLFASFAFLFQPLYYFDHFPFFNIQRFGEGWLLLRHRYLNDPIIGVVFLLPFTFFFAFNIKKIFQEKRWSILQGIFISALLMLILNSFAGVNIRYIVDFVAYFAIAGAVYVLTSFQAQPSCDKQILRGLVLALILISMNNGQWLSRLDMVR